MADKLVGQNYTPLDHVAKVTGRARYAEDFRADGMLFCKLLISPMPHARVRSIDTSAAMAMPGVRAILTADDLPDLNGAERALTNEPFYAGEPIAAVAAVDELTAAEAIERITVDLEPLPFVTNAIDALRPDGPSAREQGNVWGPPPPAGGGGPPQPVPVQTVRWTGEQFAEAAEGRLPMGEPVEQWAYGDLEAGFKDAALVLDETMLVQSTGHHPMETRSAMAYWQNGKLYLHASTQSVQRTVENVARWVGIEPSDLVLICEYTGGGFGSKGGGAVSMAIPALLSRKANAPVMMRISREEESYIGRTRTNMTGRVKMGLRKDGRITALDLYIVQDSAAYGPMGDFRSAANAASLIYQPLAMRVARDQRAHQYASALAAAVARSDAGRWPRRTGADEGGEAARSRPGRHPPDQRARGQGALRRAASERQPGARHERVREGGARSRPRALQVGRAQGARRQAQRRESARHRRHRRPARRRLDRLRRPDDDSSGRKALRADRRRESRHALDAGPGARRRRHPRDAVGEGRGDLGRHEQGASLQLSLRRQPDHACDDAGEPRGRHGRQAEAAGDRGAGLSAARPTTTSSATSGCTGAAIRRAG